MDHAAVRIAVRLALCAACSAAVWHWLGLVPAVATAPLFGVALARPLLELASDLRHVQRAYGWRDREGRHCAYRGIPVDVVEDADHHRWVRAADVRRIVGHTGSDGALSLSYPQGWRSWGRPPQPYFSADALLVHLAKQPSAQALQFAHWVRRDVALPAQRTRARLGLPPAPPA
jgi:hypothetical protein